ncbi:MAG: DUF1844 domain-containing protein [Candidatus Acidiferrales bacterium]
MADAKHEETFKVIDRRLFGEDGELRKDVVEQERRDDEAAEKKAASQAQQKAKAAASAPKPAAPAASTSAQQGGFAQPAAAQGLVAPDGSQELAVAEEAGDASAGGEEHSTSRSFQLLVDFLTRNAAAMLGGMADPRTGQAFVDLEGAREVIDMLDALREKTRGNLSKDDDNLLIEVLGSLKLTFMEISKAAAEQMAKKAKGK